MAKQKKHSSSKRKSTARAKPPKVTGQRLDVGEEELQKTNQALQERVKELNCLYGLAQLVERPKITLEGIFQGLVELIPPGWQYPEITAARITFEKRRFKTGNFRKTAWLQSADIKVHGKKTGTIEVCYLKKRLPMDEGPFLRQERDLLDALAERLSRIAEREQAEEQLKATNQQLRQQNKLVTNVLESLAHPFYVIDANDYTVKLANRAAKFGPLTEESTCYALTHKVSKPCRGAERPCPLNEIKRTKKPATTEHRHYDKDGNCRDIEVHAHPIFDSAGKISQIIEYCLDITERKKAEEETRQQHKNFLAIFDAAPVAMLLIDENTVVTKINDVAAKLVGKSPSKMTNLQPGGSLDCMHVSDDPRGCGYGPHCSSCPIRSTFEQVFSSGQAVHGVECQPTLLIGQRKVKPWLEVSAEPLTLNGKKHAIVAIRNITERKKAEEQLKAGHQQLQASEQQLRAANQQLRAIEQQLRAANQQLEASNQQLRASEEELRKAAHDLAERVKELNCLYGLSRLVGQPEITLEGIFQGLAELIPPACQYPEITAGRITFEKRRFKTANFRKTAWLQSADIKVHGKKTGTIEVCYLRKRPPIDEGPFLKEERNLLNVLAERLGHIVEREKAQEEIENLAKFPSENPNPILRISSDCRIIYANQGSAPVLEVWQRKEGEVLPEPCAGRAKEAFRSGKPLEFDFDCGDRIFCVTMAPVPQAGYLNAYAYDITERKKAEEQIKAINHQLTASEQQLTASNQQLRANEQQLRAANQQLQATEQQLRAANRQLEVDIAQRKKVEEELRAYRRRLRDLASELVLAEERLRRRIARDLHDDVGQDLLSVKMRLAEVRKGTTSAKQSAALEGILKSIDRTIQNTRSLLYDLSPPVLYELGFEPAVEWLTEKLQADHGIAAVFEDDGQAKLLADDLRIGLFRAVRELLVNIVKHAQAKNVKVSARRDGPNIRVEVEDDGVGFDVKQTQIPGDLSNGFGLFDIRERLQHCGGSFQLESKPGRGTRLTLTAPLKQ